MTPEDYQFVCGFAERFRTEHGYTRHRSLHLHARAVNCFQTLSFAIAAMAKRDRTRGRIASFVECYVGLHGETLRVSARELDRIEAKMLLALKGEPVFLHRLLAGAKVADCPAHAQPSANRPA